MLLLMRCIATARSCFDIQQSDVFRGCQSLLHLLPESSSLPCPENLSSLFWHSLISQLRKTMKPYSPSCRRMSSGSCDLNNKNSTCHHRNLSVRSRMPWRCGSAMMGPQRDVGDRCWMDMRCPQISIDFPVDQGILRWIKQASPSSDQAAAAEKVDKSSTEAVLREQMQRHKKDLQSMLEVPLFGISGYRKGIEGFFVQKS